MRRGFPKGAHFRSAPLADFFGYFLVQRQESNITALMVCEKVYIVIKRPIKEILKKS